MNLIKSNKNKRGISYNNLITSNKSENIILNNSIKKEEEKTKTNSTISHFEKFMKPTITELNDLSYKEALIKDKRTYFEYYLSLVKTKHSLIFSFFPVNDFNSRIIKIDLFLILFVAHFVINALFFTSNTLHKIYMDSGYFNILYQFPQILYSAVISGVINIVAKGLALTENNIIELKQFKDSAKIENKIKDTNSLLIKKFVIYFISGFLSLIFFIYYIACFCAVYENTQIHLIKDTLISWGLGFVYPLFIFLIPGIFRIYSLRKKSRCIYQLSKILQLI
jgi:hypothetical protein